MFQSYDFKKLCLKKDFNLIEFITKFSIRKQWQKYPDLFFSFHYFQIYSIRPPKKKDSEKN